MLLIALSTPCSATEPSSLGPPLAEQGQYPERYSGAEILTKIAYLELDENGFWLRRHYCSVRILDQAAARDYGRISIAFNHYYSSTSLEFARVRNSDGEVKSVSKDAIQVRVLGGGQDFYEDRSEIVFSLPDVAPGTIIEFQYVNKTIKKAIDTVSSSRTLAHWFQERVGGDGWRADGVHQFHYEIRLPKSSKPFFTVNSQPKQAPRKSSQANRNRYTFNWQNLSALVIEDNMVPLNEFAPGIDMSTSQNWALVDEWTWAKVADKLQPSAPLRQALDKLQLPADATRDDKARAVYGFLQDNIRYVFAHLGRGGYDPHRPEETLAQGYGDCKDQAVLAVALLRALGVEAYPTLIETPHSGKSNTTNVALIFDHMIVWLAGDTHNKPLWLDTTPDRALFPGVSNQLKGQTALIVDGRGGNLTQVDAAVFNDNRVDLHLNYRTQKTGATEVKAVYKASGLFEQSLRSWWKHDANRDTSVRQFLANIIEDKGLYDLSYQVLNTEDLFKPALIEATFAFHSADPTDPTPTYGASFLQLYRMVGGLGSMQTPESRKTTYVDTLATTLAMNITFRGLASKIPTLLESGYPLKSNFFQFQQKGKMIGDDYHVAMNFQKPELKLSPAQYKHYHRDLVHLSDTGSWVVRLMTAPATEQQNQLDSVAAKHSQDSIQYQLALVRHLLDQGQFNEALAPATKAVERAPNNGEAWYLLGTAQGLNSLLQESQASFIRAEKLGYIP